MFLKHFTPDRRRRKRQLLNTSVRVLTENGWIDALGINISDVGMALFAIANMPVGSQIRVELVQPGSSETMQISGTVRHRALYLYGIEFRGELQPEHATWEPHATETPSQPGQSG